MQPARGWSPAGHQACGDHPAPITCNAGASRTACGQADAVGMQARRPRL